MAHYKHDKVSVDINILDDVMCTVSAIYVFFNDSSMFSGIITDLLKLLRWIVHCR